MGFVAGPEGMPLRLTLLMAALLLVMAGCNYRAAPPGPRLGLPAPPEMAAPGPLSLLAKHHTPSVSVAAPTPVYRLDSGDRLRIAVFGQENLSRTYAVDGGGFISMPLIGAVLARGLTTYELERRLTAQLQEQYIKDPKVTVEVETYRPFFILGEVQRPGQYPYVNGMTVQTAVAIAGGYTERARERDAQVTRRLGDRVVARTVPNGFPVQPGDTVYVRERFF